MAAGDDSGITVLAAAEDTADDEEQDDEETADDQLDDDEGEADPAETAVKALQARIRKAASAGDYATMAKVATELDTLTRKGRGGKSAKRASQKRAVPADPDGNEDSDFDGNPLHRRFKKVKRRLRKLKQKVRAQADSDGEGDGDEEFSSSDSDSAELFENMQQRSYGQLRQRGAIDSSFGFDLDLAGGHTTGAISKKVFKEITKGKIAIAISDVLLCTSIGHKLGKLAPEQQTTLSKDAWQRGWRTLATVFEGAMNVPQHKLDAYESRILGFFDDYRATHPKGAMLYDAQYRALAQEEFARSQVMPNFALSQRLFNSVFNGFKCSTCTICGSTTHFQHACKVLHGGAGATQGADADDAGGGSKGGGGGKGGGARTNSELKIDWGGEPVCFNFQSEKGCSRSHCRFAHKCKTCGSEQHGAHACSKK